MPVQRTKKQAIGQSPSILDLHLPPLFQPSDSTLLPPGAHHDPSVPVVVKEEAKPAAFAFAPNVTPTTFTDPPPSPAEEAVFPPAPQSLLFPDTPLIQFDNLDPTSFQSAPDASAAPKRKKATGRKKAGEDPSRPPNAFILFRASFIKSQHVPTSVESNHSTLSKIIGMTWQSLPPEERSVWQHRALIAQEDHKRKFPNLAIKTASPAGSSKGKAATKQPAKPKRKLKEVAPKDEVRCQKIAALMLEGKKGVELAAAINKFDETHVPLEPQTRFEVPLTVREFRRRRSSSVPVPDGPPGVGCFQLDAPETSSMAQQRAASAGPEQLAQPIELGFNMDMFAPGALQAQAEHAFSFEAPPDTVVRCPRSRSYPLSLIIPPQFDPSFSFQPSGPVAAASPPIDPLSVGPLSPAYGGMPPPSSDYVDPAMPPLVERPYDPLTDHLMDFHAPRLSVGTLHLLTQLHHGHADEHSPVDQSPFGTYDAPTPPPLSACTSLSQEDLSTPGTPVNSAPWGWPAQAPSPQEYASHEASTPNTSCFAQESDYSQQAYGNEYQGYTSCSAGTPTPAAMVTFRVNYAEPPKCTSPPAPIVDSFAPWAVHANVPMTF